MFDTQVYDAATVDQQKEQRSSGKYDDSKDDYDNEERMDEDWELPCEESGRVDKPKVGDGFVSQFNILSKYIYFPTQR